MSDLIDMNVGIEDFKKIIKTNPSYYVDKTSFIKQLSKENVALFTRPRRFGKTLTMSMLKYFFEMNYENPSDISATVELFKDLDISKDSEFCKQHMGQYPVISLSLKEIKGNDIEDAAKKIGTCFYNSLSKYWKILSKITTLSPDTQNEIEKYKTKINNLKDRNIRNTPEKDLQDITDVLYFLTSAINEAFNKKTIVIIDEYDVPLEKSRGKYYQSMVGFIRDLFSITFKTNDYLEKGFLTGCLRVSRESIFTGLNNIPVYDCSAEKYSKLFGFTNEEVKQMLEYYNLSKYFNTIKEWYDGYEIGVTEIYNPFSVSFYIDKLLNSTIKIEPDCAWKNSSSNDFLLEFVNYLPNDETDEFKKLLDGQNISKKLNTSLNYGDLEKHDTTDLWTMLYSTGYLTKSGTPTTRSEFILRIPNEEVKLCFEEKIVDYFKSSKEYKNYGLDLLKALRIRNKNKIEEILDDLLPKYLGLRDIGSDKEYVYHSFLEGIFACRGVNAKSQHESGEGYPDISLILENEDSNESMAIILELKKATTIDNMEEQCLLALKQCHDKEYYKKFLDDPTITKINMYGITFCNRKCLVKSEELNLPLI